MKSLFKKTTIIHKPESSPASNVQPLPFGPWQSVIAVLAIFFASQFFAVVVLGIYAGLQGWSAQQASDWTTKSVYAQFWLVVLIESTVTGLLYLLLRRRKATFRMLGFVKTKWRDLGYALAGFAVYFPVLLATTQLITVLAPTINVDQKQDIGFNTATSGLPLVLVFISLVILPPLVEEALFRGFLYGGLRGKLKFLPSALITSVLFALPHTLGNDPGSSLLWIAGVDTFILSLVLVYLREKTGSLWPGIFLHMLKNGLAFLSLFVFHVV